MNIGKSIKLLRTMLNIKQKELAKNIGVSSNYLSMIEANKREPSLSFLKSASKELDVPISFLFMEDMEKIQNLKGKKKKLYNNLKNILFEIQKIRIVSKKSA